MNLSMGRSREKNKPKTFDLKESSNEAVGELLAEVVECEAGVRLSNVYANF